MKFTVKKQFNIYIDRPYLPGINLVLTPEENDEFIKALQDAKKMGDEKK